jgi:hypothetical protein
MCECQDCKFCLSGEVWHKGTCSLTNNPVDVQADCVLTKQFLLTDQFKQLATVDRLKVLKILNENYTPTTEEQVEMLKLELEKKLKLKDNLDKAIESLQQRIADLENNLNE